MQHGQEINKNSMIGTVLKYIKLVKETLSFFFIELWLIYTVVLVSGVQQSVSVVHVYIFFFMLFSTVVYHRILNVVPYAVW